MQRATQLFLNLADFSRTPRGDFTPLTTVTFSSLARQAVMRHLDVKGHWQGGTLFGEVQDGIFAVRQVTPLGPPAWGRQPLVPHLPYLLGWSDTLYALHGEAIDWHGNWIAAPNGHLPDERADLTWLALGAQLGLFDDLHTLVIVGLRDGYLSGRAYSWSDGAPVLLDCSFDPNSFQSDPLF